VTRAAVAAVAAVVAAAGCGRPAGQGAATTTTTTRTSTSTSTSTTRSAADVQEEVIAVVQKAMNDLAPVANQCWAAGAADDFRLAGKVTMMIAFDGEGRARASVDHDTTGDAVLTGCLGRVLEAYRWPGVMAGQAIELPFAFTAPHGQNTIDRRLVAAAGAQGAHLQVLVDEKNTGATAASMIEVDLDAGATLAMARAPRDEIWIFLDPARVGGPGGPLADAGALDVAVVRTGGFRQVAAPAGAAARAVVVLVPGGPEGAARAGALPDPTATPPRRATGPELHRLAAARRRAVTGGAVTTLLDLGRRKVPAQISRIELVAGTRIATYQHDHAAELLYVLSGRGTLTVDGGDLPLGPTTVAQIPPGTLHSLVASGAVTVLQVLVPPQAAPRAGLMK
jgi:quercetin dioxygenase-like cupin family protein